MNDYYYGLEGLANKGYTPWNKGIPCSEETKLKISEVNKGIKSRLGSTIPKKRREK